MKQKKDETIILDGMELTEREAGNITRITEQEVDGTEVKS